MKNFLVLGIGNAQVDLINALRDSYKTHACSNTDQGLGLGLVDKFVLLDIIDKEAVLEYCKTQNINRVYSIGSDVAMPTASWVSEQLNLPYLVNYRTALCCNAKHIFRKLLKETYGSVDFQEVRTINETLKLNFPIMVKPADSQGQRGVRLINNPAEYRLHFPVALSHSRSGIVIIDEFVSGLEISVNAFVAKGKVVFSLTSDRIIWPGLPGGIIHKHSIPAATISTTAQKNINQLVQVVVEKLGIDNGPVYFQIVMQRDQPKLIEVTPRLDGCHIWRLIKYATGVDLLAMTLQALENVQFNDPMPTPVINEKWVLEFFCQPPNTKFDQTIFTIHRNSVFHDFFYADGNLIKNMNGYMEKCGYQIIREDV